ncbi:MAG: PIF1 family DEAD/DEAH box helicase, partial [Candidatus Bipolaricaulis sp.]|nr:PIF1 family DEAD/DEAH box helicase [Candidatus Bipolaricaulis sp.]
MKQEEALKVLKLGHNVFLTGPPGSGKTFLLNQYIDYLKEKHKGVAITASTGIAATHLQGTTIHSWSGLGIKNNLTKGDLNKLLKKSYLRRNFEGTEVLIIDEISMLHASQFDLINKICQSFLKSARPFGGLQVVCSGDFFQLPPISRGQITKFVSQSWSWKTMDIKICHLEEQYRQQKEDDLFNLLNHIRNNEIEKACQILIEKRPRQDFKREISIRLYTHNIDVDRINNAELKKIDGPERAYYMTSSGNKRLAESLRRNCLAPERLVVKKGAKVMFVKNNFKEGYVNGTLGQVIDFEDGWPLVKTAGGREIKATPMIWAIEKNNLVKAQIKQIPLRLAWAITVHKSQGMNLDAAEIDIS